MKVHVRPIMFHHGLDEFGEFRTSKTEHSPHSLGHMHLAAASSSHTLKVLVLILLCSPMILLTLSPTWTVPPLDDVDTAAHTASGIEGRLISLLCETTLPSRSASCQDSVVSRPDSCWCKFQPWVVGSCSHFGTLAAHGVASIQTCTAASFGGPPSVQVVQPYPRALLSSPSCLCNTSPITEDPTSLGAQGRFHVHRVMRSTSTPSLRVPRGGRGECAFPCHD